MTNRYSVYTGPTVTETAAKYLRNAGLNVYLEGTEHVYVEADSALTVLLALGPTWKPRDIQRLP